MAQPFVHLELNTPDLTKAKDFYGKLFGWTFYDFPIAHGIYSLFKPDSGPGGGIMSMKEAPTAWLAYVGVDDIRAPLTMPSLLALPSSAMPSPSPTKASSPSSSTPRELRSPFGSKPENPEAFAFLAVMLRSGICFSRWGLLGCPILRAFLREGWDP